MSSLHPTLYTGLNSAPVSGDEMNGAGYNEPVWPAVISSEALPLVLAHQEEYWSDINLRVPREDRDILVPRENRVIVVRG